MGGTRGPEPATADLRSPRRRGIEVVEAEVVGIEPASQRVRTTQGELPFDRLVVAPGAATDPEAFPGFRERAHHLYRLDAARRRGEALPSLGDGRVAVLVSRLPSSARLPPSRPPSWPTLSSAVGACATGRAWPCTPPSRSPCRWRPGRGQGGGRPPGRPGHGVSTPIPPSRGWIPTRASSCSQAETGRPAISFFPCPPPRPWRRWPRAVSPTAGPSSRSIRTPWPADGRG